MRIKNSLCKQSTAKAWKAWVVANGEGRAACRVCLLAPGLRPTLPQPLSQPGAKGLPAVLSKLLEVRTTTPEAKQTASLIPVTCQSYAQSGPADLLHLTSHKTFFSHHIGLWPPSLLLSCVSVWVAGQGRARNKTSWRNTRRPTALGFDFGFDLGSVPNCPSDKTIKCRGKLYNLN